MDGYVVRSLGRYHSIWSLVLTCPTFLAPFSVWRLMGFFRGIPVELVESAMVDGASCIHAL